MAGSDGYRQSTKENGFCLWFTGLSGAGKTTISKLIEAELRSRRNRLEILDGDVIRENLSKGLGFSKEDRDTNIRRIAFVADLLSRNGVPVITAAISPYRETRREARALMGGRFIEVYVKASVETCAERDVKGLYEKAFKGEIKEFTGVSDPYEVPEHAEIIVDTEVQEPNESASQIISYLEHRALIPVREPAGV
jgi:adenylyl-sulfate kinase